MRTLTAPFLSISSSSQERAAHEVGDQHLLFALGLLGSMM